MSVLWVDSSSVFHGCFLCALILCLQSSEVAGLLQCPVKTSKSGTVAGTEHACTVWGVEPENDLVLQLQTLIFHWWPSQRLQWWKWCRLGGNLQRPWLIHLETSHQGHWGVPLECVIVMPYLGGGYWNTFVQVMIQHLCPPLLTWINLNPSMDK